MTKTIAWTGGYIVQMPKLIPLARQLYREQLKLWRAYWGELPEPDICDLFKNRAWHDAYATYRENRSTFK